MGYKRKNKHWKKVVKAWLVARGFEKDSSNILKDSLNCTKESMILIITLFASNRWAYNVIDINPEFI